MTTPETNRTPIEDALELIIDNGMDGLGEAIRILLNEAMKVERSHTLAAQPYERTAARRGHANGFKPKTVNTRLGRIQVEIPQVRGDVEFYPSALEKGIRSERALVSAIAEMYIQGVSTRKVTDVLEKLCGLEITSTQVSRATALLDDELQAWRTRPLGACPYVILDARYEKVRQAGNVVSCAVLIAIGIGEDGHRRVLGASVSLSEAELHWREFLTELQQRGLHGVKQITSDSHAGLKAALAIRFTGVAWQRCQFHLQQNALQLVPKVGQRSRVAAELRDILQAPTRLLADERLRAFVQKWAKQAPKLAAWAEENIPEGFTVLALPMRLRARLRTSNPLERTNREIKRRTRVVGVFPNEPSLLRLVTAILAEISDEWETGKIYLDLSTDKENE